MSNPMSPEVSKQTLQMVVTQLTYALSAAKDIPPDVQESGQAFLAALKKWAEKKAA